MTSRVGYVRPRRVLLVQVSQPLGKAAVGGVGGFLCATTALDIGAAELDSLPSISAALAALLAVAGGRAGLAMASSLYGFFLGPFITHLGMNSWRWLYEAAKPANVPIPWPSGAIEPAIIAVILGTLLGGALCGAVWAIYPRCRTYRSAPLRYNIAKTLAATPVSAECEKVTAHRQDPSIRGREEDGHERHERAPDRQTAVETVV